MASQSDVVDVIIIGGSHAGLSAALTLYRATHTCLIFDSGTARNAISKSVHLTPGWDNKDPNELRAVCREELLATGLVQFVFQKVVKATKGDDDLFEVTDAEGKRWKGRKILLALGVLEKHPDIKGFTENYGKSIYHCLFCKGYEKRGPGMAGILAQGPLEDIAISTIFAADGKKLVKHVKLYTNGNATFAAQLAESGKVTKGMSIDDRKLIKITDVGGELRIDFDQGPPDTLAFLTHQPDMMVDDTLPQQLGCEIVPKTGIKVTPPFNSTTAPGVYAAGDCSSGLRTVLMGMAMGSCAAVGIARELPGHNE